MMGKKIVRVFYLCIIFMFFLVRQMSDGVDNLHRLLLRDHWRQMLHQGQTVPLDL